MKKFRLRIVIEQEQTWRVSQLADEGNPLPMSDDEIARLLIPAETAQLSAPAVYRRSLVSHTFSDYRARFIRLVRRAGRKGKT